MLATGCNQVFEINTTALVDARYFDVGIDAPFTCPSVGETPTFDVSLQQVVLQQADQYTTSPTTGRAIGILGLSVFEGPVDGPMTEQSGFGTPGCLSCTEFLAPRLTPEGDAIYATRQSQTDLNAHLVRFRSAGPDKWASDLDLGEVSSYWISSVSRGPTRRVVLNDGAMLREYTVTDVGLELVQSYTPADLAVSDMQSPMLTADGLRMLFVLPDFTTPKAYMTDRPDLDSRFGPARLLPGVPAYDGAYMLEDCSRVYVSGLGSVFYAPRL